MTAERERKQNYRLPEKTCTFKVSILSYKIYSLSSLVHTHIYTRKRERQSVKGEREERSEKGEATTTASTVNGVVVLLKLLTPNIL